MARKNHQKKEQTGNLCGPWITKILLFQLVERWNQEMPQLTSGIHSNHKKKLGMHVQVCMCCAMHTVIKVYCLLHDMIGLPQILLCHRLHLMRIHCQERFAPDNAVCMHVSTSLLVMSQQAIACRLHQLHAPLYSMRVYWGLFGGTLLASKELSPDNHHHKNLVQQSGKINKVDMVTTICRVHLRG